MAAAASALRPRLTRQAAPLFLFALAVAYAVAAIVAIRGLGPDEPTTTYAAASVAARAADLAAGLTLLFVGAFAFVSAAERRLGLLAVLLGVLWFAPDWEGWIGHPVVRSLGSLAAPFLLVVIVHLALAAPRARFRSHRVRLAVGGAYAITALLAMAQALVRDPFLDRYCWRDCSDNVFLVHAKERVAHDLDVLLLGLGVVLGVLVLVLGGTRLYRASPAARRALTPLLVPAAIAGAAEAAYAAAILHTPLENPRAPGFMALFLTRSFALAALACGIAWSVAVNRRARSAVARLATELAESPPPGKLQDALAAAVGDSTLRVAYWLETSRRFVGTDGKPIPEPSSEEGRASTPILRGTQRVAVLAYDAALIDGAALEREIGPAARLAVENERLQAEVLAKLEDLRRSRARIVEQADRERQRLERNLHDGAQQRLLALSYDLRLALASAEADDDAELTDLMQSAIDDTQAALEELRELAHGIYPAVLTEAGLETALESLADEAPLAVELGPMSHGLRAPSVEAAAYFVVAEAVDDAIARAASWVRVRMGHPGERLVVTVEDDGERRLTSLVHVADRIGALGGSVELGPTTLRANIPCA